ncbi:other/AgaK1 protein kinase [Ephemerocybe angulata]|uniref:Other/AgaK1 protein kinase n=1 Tax=Ephemerocybe angulata TaxID=980116 RepID=A0A8H6HVD8_9AGAR|nr:other/AgaK1 protein kinase [Tulosesus angulatus]
MKLFRLDSLSETVYWTYRSWRKGYTLTNDLRDWAQITEFRPMEVALQKIAESWARWQFLLPFFASHGLHIYDLEERPPAKPPKHPLSQHSSMETWPWARRAYEDEKELCFNFVHAVRVWPARDDNGHEVMIRLVSGSDMTDELRAFQRLNTPKARSDPRNHTLPALKYLRFDGMVFVVMPRWGSGPFSPFARFSTISELFDLVESFYEGLEFLHENRIAHRDIYQTNLVINILGEVGIHRVGMRKLGEVKYAFIDFDACLTFPEDSDLDAVRVEREMRNQVEQLGLKPGMCNPFKDDVLCLAVEAQRMLRVAEHSLPEVGQFFEWIWACDYEETPSATVVLQRLRQLRGSLSDDQLKQPPAGMFWARGRIEPYR